MIQLDEYLIEVSIKYQREWLQNRSSETFKLVFNYFSIYCVNEANLS